MGAAPNFVRMQSMATCWYVISPREKIDVSLYESADLFSLPALAKGEKEVCTDGH
jgi:hypothetical protein